MSNPERLERFLFGTLPEDERLRFISEVRTDAALKRRLEAESAIDAQACSQAWWTQQLLQPGVTLSLCTKTQWQSLVQCCFLAAARLEPDTKGAKKIISFPRPLRYLAAACLIGLIAGTAHLINNHRFSPQESRLISISRVHPVRHVTHTPAASSVITFDSLVLYPAVVAHKKLSQTPPRDNIVRFGENTAALVEKNSSVSVSSISDSAVSLTLTGGSALFSVEKNRYRAFCVHTPLSTVTVTGTIFRVAVDTVGTLISVLEGSVLVRSLFDTMATTVFGGMSATVGKTGVTLIPGDSAATMPHRPNLLRDFLMENSVWENGAFVRTGIRADAPALSARFSALRRSVRNREANTDSLVLDFAYSYPNTGMTGELLLDLSGACFDIYDTTRALAFLDSAILLGDSEHAAEALNRAARHHLGSQGDLASARHVILRFCSRFPYDPRCFKQLGSLVDSYWNMREPGEAQALLKQAIELVCPDSRMEPLLFRHAENLETVARDFSTAIEWYLYLADRYPTGAFRDRALDRAAQCVAKQGLSRHERFSRTIQDFLHPDGLKR